MYYLETAGDPHRHLISGVTVISPVKIIAGFERQFCLTARTREQREAGSGM
jgi:hypothetical protein